MLHLDWIDYTVIGTYFLCTALIGVWVARARTTSEDLFLAGRSLGPAAVGFSLYAANVSSDTLVGLPGAAYRTGISVANYEWMAGIVLIFSCIFVLPVVMRARVTTIPELMERRFDTRLRLYLSGVTLFLSIVLGTAGSLYAGALVIRVFIPGLGLWEMCGAIAAFTAIYTAAGGLRAVVYTDVMQAVVLIAGSIVLTVLVFGKFDYSWANVTRRVAADKLHLLQPIGGQGVPWLGTFVGLPIAGFYYWTMDQYVVQRILGARDLKTAGRASVIAGGLKLLNLFFMVLPGAMAVALIPHLANADSVYPQMVARFTPPGLTGLIVAGLIAALMSSVSATLNSAATLVTVDFVQPRRPEMTQGQIVLLGRVLTFAFAALAALWAPLIIDFKGLFAYLQQMFAFIASPLVAVFLKGLWDRRLGSTAALRGLICGHAFSLAVFLLEVFGVFHLHFTITAGIVLLATWIMTQGWERWLGEKDRPPEDDARLSVIARKGLQHVPIDVAIASAGIILAIIVMLIVFD